MSRRDEIIPSSRVSALEVRPIAFLEALVRLGAGENQEGQFMPLYEHVFLSRQDVSGQQVETLTEQFKGIIEANGGTVSKVEQWGLKSVAFRIRKNRKAHYTLINIDAPSAAVAEMERQQRINEDVLRILTIRVEELEEGQSAMLQKRDREDRDDRGGRFGDRGDRPRSGGFRGGEGGGGFRGGDSGGFRSERRPRAEDGEGAE